MADPVRSIRVVIALVLGAGAPLLLHEANFAQQASLLVRDAWVREAPASRPTSAAYMTIQNESDREAVIVSASTPAARTVELHEMRDEDGRMKMRKVDRVVVAAHGRVDLRPGGLHIMLFELTGPLVARTTMPFTLTLADGRSVKVEATVRGLGGSE
jgi:copper(I)-binding protein